MSLTRPESHAPPEAKHPQAHDREIGQQGCALPPAEVRAERYFMRSLRGSAWVALYLLIVLAPLGVALIGAPPPGRSFWVEYSVALGFIGLSMMGLQFAITARFRPVARPFGTDVLLQFHWQASLLATGLVLLHPIILFIFPPERLEYLALLRFWDPETPWRARWALLSTAALIGLVAVSVFRERVAAWVPFKYEVWHWTHGLLAVLVVVAGLVHALMVGHYTALTWKQVFWAGMSGFFLCMLAYTRLWKPTRLLGRPWKVADVKEERGGVTSLTLEADGHDGMKFRPGQFAWVRVGVSPFNFREHPFSFAGSAEQQGRVTFGIKALGDFTNRVPDLRPGTRAYVDGPYGYFSYERHPAPGYVFVAGGIGITPILSHLRTLADRDCRFPLILIYANPDLDNVAYLEEIEALEKKLDLEVIHVLDKAPENWPGETGYVTHEMLEKYLPEERKARFYFLCGPPRMMEAVRGELQKVDVPLTHIQYERFDLA